MMGHYAEAPVDLILKMTDAAHTVFNMTYNPSNGEWKQRKLTDYEEEVEEKSEKEKGKGKEKAKEGDNEDMQVEV